MVSKVTNSIFLTASIRALLDSTKYVDNIWEDIRYNHEKKLVELNLNYSPILRDIITDISRDFPEVQIACTWKFNTKQEEPSGFCRLFDLLKTKGNLKVEQSTLFKKNEADLLLEAFPFKELIYSTLLKEDPNKEDVNAK
jgi:hypothetical protein